MTAGDQEEPKTGGNESQPSKSHTGLSGLDIIGAFLTIAASKIVRDSVSDQQIAILLQEM